jgi:hypothetical protein
MRIILQLSPFLCPVSTLPPYNNLLQWGSLLLLLPMYLLSVILYTEDVIYYVIDKKVAVIETEKLKKQGDFNECIDK